MPSYVILQVEYSYVFYEKGVALVIKCQQNAFE